MIEVSKPIPSPGDSTLHARRMYITWFSFNLNRLHEHSGFERRVVFCRWGAKNHTVLQKYMKQYLELYVLAGTLAQGCLGTVTGLPAGQSKLSEGMSANEV